jgi:hypothetical protein
VRKERGKEEENGGKERKEKKEKNMRIGIGRGNAETDKKKLGGRGVGHSCCTLLNYVQIQLYLYGHTFRHIL